MNRDVKFIDVNGAQVADLTPNHERALAIVDLAVLKKLTNLLKSADLYKIKLDLKNAIDDCDTMETYVAILDEEVAFHTTVNMIKEVTVPVPLADLEDTNNY